MAEFLFKSVDATNPDPTKDSRGCYKRGDLVAIFEDGHSWGSEELIPPINGGKFVRIVLTDVTLQQVKNFIQNKWGCRPDDSQYGPDDVVQGADGGLINMAPRLVRRRINIKWSLLPSGVLSTLNTTGLFVTTWATVRQYIHDKKTDTDATGDPI